MSKSIEIMIYDSSLVYVGMIDDYEYFRWTRKYRGIDDFELKINRYKNNVNLLSTNNYIVFKKGNEYRIGKIEFKEIELDGGKGSESWDIRGRSMSGLLEDRICTYQTTTGTGYHSLNFTAEEVMKLLVRFNLIDSTSDRNVSNFDNATNQLRGNVISVKARFQVLSDLLTEISYVGDVGYKVYFNLENSKFIFDIIQGLDKTYGNGINPPIIFSTDYGNIKSLTYRENKLNIKNVAVVGGQGEANLRTQVIVGTDTGINRKEVFVDARDLTTGLDQRGEEYLLDYGEETILEFEHTQTGTFEYLIDFDLGDIVTVVYPNIAQINARIVQVVEEYEVSFGEKFTLTVGSEFKDLGKVIKLKTKNTEPEIRR